MQQGRHVTASLLYIKDVLIRIQSHPASGIDELLPWNWKPPPELGHAGA